MCRFLRHFSIMRHESLRFLPLTHRLCRILRVNAWAGPASGWGNRRHSFHLLALVFLIHWTATPAEAQTPISYTGTQVGISVSNGYFFNAPSGLALDLSGNLYIADSGNLSPPSGTYYPIYVVPAGTTTAEPFPLPAQLLSDLINYVNLGYGGPTQLVVDSAGNLYFAVPDTNDYPDPLFQCPPTLECQELPYGLNNPAGIAIDTSGNLYISDTGNNQIIEIPSGGSAKVLTTSGGVPLTGLSSPMGLATDTYNNLYIADSGNNRVIKVSPNGGTGSIVPVYDGGLSNPVAVTVGNNETVYIVDQGNDTIAVSEFSGNTYALFMGLNDDFFYMLTAIATDSKGAFYIADSENQSVTLFHQVSADFGHVQLGNAGTTETLPFVLDSATTVNSVVADTVGVSNLDFTFAGNSCTSGSRSTICSVNVTFTPTAAGLRRGALVLSYSNTSLGTGKFTVPLFGIGDGPVAALSPGVASPLSTGTLTFTNSFVPFQTASDGRGDIYATDTANNRVLKIPAGGGNAIVVSIPALSPAPAGLSSPTGIAMDGAGNLFFADSGNNRIVELTASGTAHVVSDYAFSFNNPQSLFMDGSGNLFVNDAGNNQILELTPEVAAPTYDGTVDITAPYQMSTGSLTLGSTGSPPYNVSTSSVVDTSEALYISDDANNRVIKVDRFGKASTVDFSSLSQALITPHSITLDPMGNLYVLDNGGGSGQERIIQQVTTGTNSVMAFSGASFAVLSNQIAVDNSGNVLVADLPEAGGRLVQINAGQSAMSFPSTPLNSTSSALTTTVTNLGDQSLVFSANPTYTANFSENIADRNSCTSSTSLTIGMSCDVSVLFTPQSSGSLSTSITVTNNTQNVTNSTQTIVASGTTPSPDVSTTTAITFSPTSPVYGQSVTVTATISATGTPTGMVTFTDETTTATLASNVVLNSGAATATASALGVGSHSIQAVYTPIGNFLGSNGSNTVTISKASTNTGISLSGNTLTATVAALAPGAGTPTGTVQFQNGSTVIGAATLSGGTATLNVISPTPYSFVAFYSGDANFTGSTSAALISTATTVTVSSISANYGQPLTLTATVSAVMGTPTGSVIFTDLATSTTWDATLNSSGVATFMTSTLAVGSHTILAVYFPGNFQTSSGTTTVTIEKASSSTQTSAPGIFRASNGLWLLDSNADNTFDTGDQVTSFAGNGLTPQSTDIAVAGDWSGNGITKIGLYRPSTGAVPRLQRQRSIRWTEHRPAVSVWRHPGRYSGSGRLDRQRHGQDRHLPHGRILDAQYHRLRDVQFERCLLRLRWINRLHGISAGSV
jgi:sugar lactone lactonase YvrE